MGTFLLPWAGESALEYMNTKGSPQTLSQVFAPGWLPLGHSDLPPRSSDVNSSWSASSRWASKLKCVLGSLSGSRY